MLYQVLCRLDANGFFFSSTRKANKKLHQYFWGSNKNFRDGGFLGTDRNRTEWRESLTPCYAVFPVSKRVLNPVDANVYAEIRKSTMEPPPQSSDRRQNGVGNGEVAPRAGGHQPLATDIHDDSLQDLTLIDNYIYRSAAECSKPARNSYVPGECSSARRCMFICATVLIATLAG